MSGLAWALLALAAGGGLLLVALSRRVPRSDRDWAADHAIAPSVTFADGHARIENLRDFRHTSAGAFTERYQDVTVRLNDVLRVWLVVAPFARAWRGLAHVFVSFELAGGRCIAVSIEARRPKGARYSVVGGMLRRFEVTYVIGTERDLLGLRALRGDPLLLYPSRATPDQARALFADMLAAAERVRTEPRFYNSVTHNCATLLHAHVNRVLRDPLPYGWPLLLPGYSDGVALRRGLLDTDLGLAEARARFQVGERVRSALREDLEGADFSRVVRPGSGPGEALAAGTQRRPHRSEPDALGAPR